MSLGAFVLARALVLEGRSLPHRLGDDVPPPPGLETRLGSFAEDGLVGTRLLGGCLPVGNAGLSPCEVGEPGDFRAS